MIINSLAVICLKRLFGYCDQWPLNIDVTIKITRISTKVVTGRLNLICEDYSEFIPHSGLKVIQSSFLEENPIVNHLTETVNSKSFIVTFPSLSFSPTYYTIKSWHFLLSLFFSPRYHKYRTYSKMHVYTTTTVFHALCKIAYKTKIRTEYSLNRAYTFAAVVKCQ